MSRFRGLQVLNSQAEHALGITGIAMCEAAVGAVAVETVFSLADVIRGGDPMARPGFAYIVGIGLAVLVCEDARAQVGYDPATEMGQIVLKSARLVRQGAGEEAATAFLRNAAAQAKMAPERATLADFFEILRDAAG